MTLTSCSLAVAMVEVVIKGGESERVKQCLNLFTGKS